MNSGIFIVRILTPLEQSFFEDKTAVAEMVVRFPQSRRRRSYDKFRLSLWGNLTDDFVKYFRVRDYVIVQGILSVRSDSQKNKEIELTVKKIYPFLLDGETI